MIVVKLIGGLGNQLFQYAFGRSVSLHHKTDLFLDISDLQNKDLSHTYRNYSLNKFYVKAKIAPDNLILDLDAKKSIIERALNKIPYPGKLKVVGENKIHFDPEMDVPEDNSYLIGYWQSPLYFKDIENTLREDLKFSVPLNAKANSVLHQIQNCNSVSLHVRRGDYAMNPETLAYHGLCDITYYDQAIELIKSKVTDPVFFIFSDDPQWVRENFKLSDKIILVSNPEYAQIDDLRLMSSCKHSIMANSSFSWWGSWLIQDPKKITIAPLKWYQNDSIKTDNLFTRSTFRI